MNEMQIFSNEEFGKIRVVEINGEPWFVGKDVAEALGYVDTYGALKKHVDDEDKLVCQIDSVGQKRDVTVINESGVYSLILSSKLPQAKKFKRWITSEVLPTMRKTGGYELPQRKQQRIKTQSVSSVMRDIEATMRAMLKANPAIPRDIALASAFEQVTEVHAMPLPIIKQTLITAVTNGDAECVLKVKDVAEKCQLLDSKGNPSSRAANKLLEKLGYQCKHSNNGWTLTESGKEFGAEFPYASGTGHSGYEIRWKITVCDKIKEFDENASKSKGLPLSAYKFDA